jgi:tRNA threonylcarbamoyladenosine biosynthesis protein TsaE
VIAHSVEQTIEFGRRLGARLSAGDVICLSGDLGAGKTALAKGIGAGWGALETVTSPTFTLVHEHHRALDEQTLYHVDCYRLAGVADAWSAGLEDILYGGAGPVVIEWPEHVQDALPPAHLWIAIEYLDETWRRFILKAVGERYAGLLTAIGDEM